MKLHRNQIYSVGLVLLFTALLLFCFYFYWEIAEESEKHYSLQSQTHQNEMALSLEKPDQLENSKQLAKIKQSCDRFQLSKYLNQFTQELKIYKLKFQVTPEQKIRENECQFGRSIVTLEFENTNDSAVYLFIDKLFKEIPGIISPLNLSLQRDPSRDQPFIKGSFKFEWLNLNNEEVS